MSASPIAQPRTLDELKAETQSRADRDAYPCAGLGAAATREAMARLTSLEPDAWARAWMPIGDRHVAAAEGAERTGDRAAAEKSWREAVDVYLFARFPFDSSPAKQEAQKRMLAAFARLAKLQDPPFERVIVKFDGKDVGAWLRMPKGVSRPPVLITVGGLDSRKEHAAIRNAAYAARGIASLAFDMPGTGESRAVKAAPGAEGLFSAALDWIGARNDLDASRVVIYGSSWGGHWAARLAYTERDRLVGSVVQGGPVHGYFQPAWQRTALGNREYLFGLFEARAAVYGVDTLDDFLAYGPQLSLKDAGWLDRPSAPMFVVNGAADTQVPFEDVVMLLANGSPKDAWVNPHGGHMGRSKDVTDPWILNNVTLPWVGRRLSGSSGA